MTNERVSSGVERLDTMLGGGYYRGASVLITGFPGTAKTTLSGAFAEAACKRGERTLFVSFDSDGSEVIRNLASVGHPAGALREERAACAWFRPAPSPAAPRHYLGAHQDARHASMAPVAW